MHNFCTLFDTNYLTRGLALYDSLQQTCPAFHLYVFAFDNNCYEYLKSRQYPHLTVISLQEFEDPALLAVKPGRSIAEYCWTCTSSTILYCLQKFSLPSCTYIDADMIFYHDPQVLFDEMAGNSVMISRHRYTKPYDLSVTHGIYCVQFMCFKNDERGLKALTWWRERCLEWCYARLEDGKFGDQKYLDDWTTRFEGVHVTQYAGEGLAPWNIQQYSVSMNQEQLTITTPSGRQHPVIFFHFHGVKFYTDHKVSFCGPLYEIDTPTKLLIYIPYIKRLAQIQQALQQEGISWNVQGARTASQPGWKVFINWLTELPRMLKKDPSLLLTPKKLTFSRHFHIYSIKDLI